MKLKGTLYLIVVIAISILFVGCYKEAHKVDSDFVGGWPSVDGEYAWEISIDGDGSYTSVHGDRIVDVVKSNNKYLKIGGVKFRINQFPQFDSTSTVNNSTYDFYSMILDNVTYIRTSF